MAATGDGHNHSLQKGVAVNNDPALDIANEHHHGHLHHDPHSLRGRKDDIVYSTGTTVDKSMIPNAGPTDHPPTDPHHIHHHGVPEKSAAIAITDSEKGDSSTDQGSSHPHEDPRNHRLSSWYRRLRPAVHMVIFLLFTGWWIAGLVLHRNDMNWIIPFLLWLCITLRLIFFYVPISIIMNPARYVWRQTGTRVHDYTPPNLRYPLATLLVVGVILIGSFVSPESADNTRANRAISLFGLLVFVAVLYATSKDRSKINWQTVLTGTLFQWIIALFVLRTQAGYDIFTFLSQILGVDLLGFSSQGVIFLTDASVPKLNWFLTGVIPAIVFFVSFVSVLYYWGLLQWAIKKAATFFFWSMKVSGAEAIVAAASPFIGQGESAMLIKPFVAHMTLAELHQVMTSGFATISGSVLVVYIGLGVNGAALISSCVMSIPASLAFSKLRWPETEETLTAGRVVVPDDDEHKASNVLHAFANGAWLGIKIGGMITANLLCIIAVVALVNALLTWWGGYLNIDNPSLTLELILGYICYPIAFLLGVPRSDSQLIKVGKLIGTKVIENEFVAYQMLQQDPEFATLSSRARLIATYALCGFGNLGSLGTQIGVLSQISPSRSADVSRIAMSALLTGVLATLTSASIAGMLVTDQQAFFKPATGTS